MRNKSMEGCRFRISDRSILNPQSAIRNPQSRGVSLIAAIFIIVILAFMGVMFVSLIGTGSLTAVNDLQSAQALYVAEGGLERTIRFLDSPILDPLGVNPDRRRACANVTGDAALTNVALGQGLFRVVTEAGSPFYSVNAVALNGMIDNLVTAIPVNGDPIASGYAPYGRIMIDREIIDYSGTTANSFTGAARGRDGTQAAPHANLTRVGHYQCTTTSTGGIPDLAAPRAQRAVREGIQLQEGWAVGTAGGAAATRPLFLRFQETGWVAYNSAALNINVRLNSVSILSYTDGWAVGNNDGNEVILRWNGVNWLRIGPAAGIRNRDLMSIYCVSSNECYAVGVDGPVGERPWILQYNGVWNTVDTGNTARDVLNSVYCPASGDCWAVGNAVGGYELVYRLAGGVWNRQGASGAIPNQNLMSIFCTSANECFVVGAGGSSSRWTNIGGWTNVSPGGQQLNSVYVMDFDGDGIADDGWTVGAGNGTRPTVRRWNTNCNGIGTTGVWNNCTVAAYVPAINQDLNSVYCVDTNDCWAVGNAGGAGQRPLIFHWDGATWALNNSGLNVNEDLFGINVLGPRKRPQAAWQEVIQ